MSVHALGSRAAVISEQAAMVNHPLLLVLDGSIGNSDLQCDTETTGIRGALRDVTVLRLSCFSVLSVLEDSLVQ